MTAQRTVDIAEGNRTVSEGLSLFLQGKYLYSCNNQEDAIQTEKVQQIIWVIDS